MNAQQEASEVFTTFTQIFHALLIAYNSRYPILPTDTLSMVISDISRYLTETMIPEIQEGKKKDATVIDLFQDMGDDLAIRIGARSVYEETMNKTAKG